MKVIFDMALSPVIELVDVRHNAPAKVKLPWRRRYVPFMLQPRPPALLSGTFGQGIYSFCHLAPVAADPIFSAGL
ncbi:MAG: hypothetical protein EON90_04145 [Brevundimonas sp.]|nr:MAG: hypothetical protein EON90_04145 [Brevundimonas sp.]